MFPFSRGPRDFVAVALNAPWLRMCNGQTVESAAALFGFEIWHTADDFSRIRSGRRVALAPLAPARQKARIIERISRIHPILRFLPKKCRETPVASAQSAAATTNERSVNENSSKAQLCTLAVSRSSYFNLSRRIILIRHLVSKYIIRHINIMTFIKDACQL